MLVCANNIIWYNVALTYPYYCCRLICVLWITMFKKATFEIAILIDYMFFRHQIFILLFTFFIYASYHLSRKPISVVKVRLDSVHFISQLKWIRWSITFRIYILGKLMQVLIIFKITDLEVLKFCNVRVLQFCIQKWIEFCLSNPIHWEVTEPGLRPLFSYLNKINTFTHNLNCIYYSFQFR